MGASMNVAQGTAAMTNDELDLIHAPVGACNRAPDHHLNNSYPQRFTLSLSNAHEPPASGRQSKFQT
jgi:hypothetical protein